jgi:hypothetical protein
MDVDVPVMEGTHGPLIQWVTRAAFSGLRCRNVKSVLTSTNSRAYDCSELFFQCLLYGVMLKQKDSFAFIFQLPIKAI